MNGNIPPLHNPLLRFKYSLVPQGERGKVRVARLQEEREKIVAQPLVEGQSESSSENRKRVSSLSTPLIGKRQCWAHLPSPLIGKRHCWAHLPSPLMGEGQGRG
jgi:hypothetical protein